MRLELHIEPGGTQVERVGVFHRELANPQQTTLGPGLVTKLGLQVVPELGQLPIRRQLGGEQREDLLMSHRQQQVGLPAILELDEDPLDVVPAARLLPHLTGVHHREQHLLAADAVHLLADDLLDLVDHPLAEGKQRPGTGHQAAHEAPAHQQAVVGRLGIGGIVTKGGDVGARPAHEDSRVVRQLVPAAPG